MNGAASEALFNEQVQEIDGALLETRRWRVFERAFPVLDVGFEGVNRTPIRIRMNCQDWNELPPVIELRSFDGDYLKTLPSGPTNVFNSSPHHGTGRPFVCMAGSREYHTHSSHINDHWQNYKNLSGYDLGGIMGQLWSAWLKSNP